MNEGLFWSSYSESISLLKKLSLLKEENVHKRIPYSKNCKTYSRGKDYRVLYQELVDNRDYDILLFDDSILQMNLIEGESRLMFIQNPLEFISFESFMEDSGLHPTPEILSDLHAVFDEAYAQTLEGMNLNSGAVYLRYDVDARGRKDNENIHSYTHLHVGLNNKIRIPVGVYLTPFAFIAFVIRHVYYDVWVEAMRNTRIRLNYKIQCEELPNNLWTESEKLDFYLG